MVAGEDKVLINRMLVHEGPEAAASIARKIRKAKWLVPGAELPLRVPFARDVRALARSSVHRPIVDDPHSVVCAFVQLLIQQKDESVLLFKPKGDAIQHAYISPIIHADGRDSIFEYGRGVTTDDFLLVLSVRTDQGNE